MSERQEAGFRVVAITARRAMGLFGPKVVDLTFEAVGAPSIPVAKVGLQTSLLGVLKVRQFRLDFTDGERLTGVAPARDRPALGALLAPTRLRDLGWCRHDLNRRLETATPSVQPRQSPLFEEREGPTRSVGG